ncbi:MAG: molybdopterin-dependent oxidoreductase, partial [Acidimicrobiales bacterium]
MLGLGAVGVVVGSRVQDAVGRVLRPIASRSGLGLSSLIPGADRFRIYSVTGNLPSESNASYRLSVTGLVSNPLSLTLADLQAMPDTTLRKD